MNKPISEILDAVAQQVIATVGELVTRTIAATSAAQQAEQQARLDDLAQQLETEGKTEIAAVLRSRAQQLVRESRTNATLGSGLGFSTEFGRPNAGHPFPTANTDSVDFIPKKRRRRSASEIALLSSTPTGPVEESAAPLTNNPTIATAPQ